MIIISVLYIKLIFRLLRPVGVANILGPVGVANILGPVEVANTNMYTPISRSSQRIIG